MCAVSKKERVVTYTLVERLAEAIVELEVGVRCTLVLCNCRSS